jgi:hypothetical protein
MLEGFKRQANKCIKQAKEKDLVAFAFTVLVLFGIFRRRKISALLSLLPGQIYIFKINYVLLKLVNVYSVRFSQLSAIKVNQILYYSNCSSKKVNLQKLGPNDNCRGIMSILIILVNRLGKNRNFLFRNDSTNTNAFNKNPKLGGGCRYGSYIGV